MTNNNLDTILTLAKAGYTSTEINSFLGVQQMPQVQQTVPQVQQTVPQVQQMPQATIPEVQNTVKMIPSDNSQGTQQYLVQQIAELQAQNRALATGKGMQNPPDMTSIAQQIVDGGVIKEKE